MNPDGAIFLSASVPDSTAPHFVAEADTSAISAAVSALMFVVLGRRRLVWGGHPAITPMVWAFAESMEIDYGAWVTLYQSKHFEDEFPEETRRFQNVVFTDKVSDEVAPNIMLMRKRMLGENKFAAAVFIGGMQGILDEHQMFVERAPQAVVVPITSAGGAAAYLAQRIGADPALSTSLDYVELFHDRLRINPAERRFRTPDEQPKDPSKRLTRPTSESRLPR